MEYWQIVPSSRHDPAHGWLSLETHCFFSGMVPQYPSQKSERFRREMQNVLEPPAKTSLWVRFCQVLLNILTK